MILREVAENLISALNAGGQTLGQKWNPLQVEAIIPSLRIDAIKEVYNGSRFRGASKRINGAWTQTFTVEIDGSIQNNNYPYLLSYIPAPAPITERMNGLIYVGGNLMNNGVPQIAKFFQAQSMDEITTLNQRGFINNGKDIVYLYIMNMIQIYGNKSLKEFTVQMVAANPVDVPNFDIETSEYPINDELLMIMVDGFKRYNSVALQQPKDTVADAQDTSSIQAVNKSII